MGDGVGVSGYGEIVGGTDLTTPAVRQGGHYSAVVVVVVAVVVVVVVLLLLL